jgi:hypothetical protein
MATHRRGTRPSQWPIRDLLRDNGSRMGGLRDPRLYAAVGGLLACSAAATVAFTAGDRPSGGPGPGDGAGPLALPAPSMVVPAPADPGTLGPGAANPEPRVPATRSPAPGRHAAAPARMVPVPRAWQRPTDDRTTAAREDAREVLDRVDEQLTAIARRAERSGGTEGVLVLPVPRADVAALLAGVGTDARCAWSAERGGARDDDGPRGRHHRADRAEAVDHGSEDRAGDEDGAGTADEDADDLDGARDDGATDEAGGDRDADADDADDADGDDADAADDDRDGADADDAAGDSDRVADEAGGDRDEADDDADGGDEDGDGSDDRADDQDRAGRHAMALLVTASPDDHGDFRTRAVDPDRVLAVLADLHGSSD